MWFTESPWPPIVILGSLGFIFGFVWGSTQRPRYLAAAVACIVACAVIWIVERQVVTEAERIEQNIYGLAKAFQQNDREAFLAYISTQAAPLRGLAASAIDQADIADDYRITDVDVRTMADDTMGESWFRANVTASVPSRHVANFRFPTRWRLLWRKEGGDWKIIEVHRYRVVADREMPIFAAGE